jgi:hypothetical protein
MSPDSEKCEKENLRAWGMFPRAADDLVAGFRGNPHEGERGKPRQDVSPGARPRGMRGWRAERRKPLASAMLAIAAAPLGAPFALMQSDKPYTRRCGDIGAHAATPYLCFRRAIKRMRGRVDLAFPVPGGRELGPLRQDAYPPAGRGLASFVSGPVCPPAPQAPHPVPLSRRLAKRPSADGVRQSVREVWRAGIRLRSQLQISPCGEAGRRAMRSRSRLRHSIGHDEPLTRYA